MPIRLHFQVWEGIKSLGEARTLAKFFQSYGPVLDYKFTRSKESGRYLGFGFVTYRDDNSVNAILQNEFHSVDVDTRTLDLKIQRAKKAYESKPGRPKILAQLYGFEGFFGGLKDVNSAVRSAAPKVSKGNPLR